LVVAIDYTMSIIFCDENKELCQAVKEAVVDKIEVVCGDVIKEHQKRPNSRIVTASNPDFSPDGGLDKALSDKGWFTAAREFFWNDHLFYVVSVDSVRQSSPNIIKRALAGVYACRDRFDLLLTGIGCGVGSLDADTFTRLLTQMLGADLRGASLRGADLRGADLGEADLREASLRGADLREASLRGADLRGASLGEADLRGADLGEADLREASLGEADLRGADLGEADLREASLRGADLREADLRGAKNTPLECHDSLNILRYQEGKLRAFKYLKDDFTSPINGNTKYEVGKTVRLRTVDCDPDDRVLCGKGLNVASLEWCVRKGDTDTFIEVEFDAKDIVSIPYNTDGKFRVRKLKVLRSFDRKQAEKLLSIHSNLK
jgi:hypothetical protein